jgi:insulysin
MVFRWPIYYMYMANYLAIVTFATILFLAPNPVEAQPLLAAAASSSANSTSSISQPVIAPLVTNVIKSENDMRDYRYLTLSNSLKVLLVYDATAKKSAVALNVNIGSHQNPKQRAGLAHFLEHMLLLSSAKYPKVNEAKEFMSSHGGKLDAHSAEENTAYSFDVETAYLDQALDRFSQFFVAPLFDANYIEREKNEIQAEYLAKINDDEKRIWDVYRSLFNAEHPAANFSNGNLESMADRQNHSLRDDVINFYNTYYSANLMSLTVISNQRLDVLQRMVEERFSLIPNHNRNISDVYPGFFQQDILPLSITIKALKNPVKELRKLTFVFPIPNYSKYYRTKPWSYLGSLLGSEASGSLLALLKSLDWADGVVSGELVTTRHQGLFQISISLTKEGVRAKDQIVSMVFDVLNTLTERGIAEWRFNELKQLNELDFRYQEKPAPHDSAIELAQAMQNYSAQDVLVGKYSFTQFDEGLIKKAAGYLRKNNVLIALVAPEVSVSAVTSYYQTPYGYTAGIPEILPLKPLYHQKILLPEPNVFIPQNTSVKARSLLPQQNSAAQRNIPSRLIDKDNFVLWFFQDSYFRSPKANLNFRFKLPVLNGSVDAALKTEVFSALILDRLNEYSYSAAQAGLHFSMTSNARGFDMAISGFTDKQNLLVNKIIGALVDQNFTEDRFNRIKENLLLKWRGEARAGSYQVLLDQVSRLQDIPYWGLSEYADLLRPLKFESFKPFSEQLLRGAKVEALFYGNLYSQDAIKLGSLVEHQLLQKKSNRTAQLEKIIRSENKNNKSWFYSYPVDIKDHVVALYIPSLSPALEDTAHMLLLHEILQPLCNKNIVSGKPFSGTLKLVPAPLKTLEGVVFVAQSSVIGSEEVVSELNSFLAATPNYLAESFVERRNAVLVKLREPLQSFAEQSERYWQSILLNDKEFTRQRDLADAVSKITPDSLRVFYESAFLQKNRHLWLSTDKLDGVTDFETILNVADYQQIQQGYLYP